MEVKEKRTYISPRLTETEIAYPISLMAGSPEFSAGGETEEEGDAKYHTSYSLWEDDEEEGYE